VARYGGGQPAEHKEARVKKIVMLRNKWVEGVARGVGDVVVASDPDANYLVACGSARLAGQDDTTPLLSFEDGIATAVPGGKRPGRKRRGNS
jgi:hypothetical protein